MDGPWRDRGRLVDPVQTRSGGCGAPASATLPDAPSRLNADLLLVTSFPYGSSIAVTAGRRRGRGLLSMRWAEPRTRLSGARQGTT